jgi:hypothetical protein
MLGCLLMIDASFFGLGNFRLGIDFSRIKRLARFLGEGENGYLVEGRLVDFPSGTVMRAPGHLAPFERAADGLLARPLLAREVWGSSGPVRRGLGNSHALEAGSR